VGTTRRVLSKADRYEDKEMLFHEVLGLLRWQTHRFPELIGGLERVRDFIVKASEDRRALTESETQGALQILARTISYLRATVNCAGDYLQYSVEPEEGDISDESYRS
jgi:hypothetical protein